jgi:hypothetical protein
VVQDEISDFRENVIRKRLFVCLFDVRQCRMKIAAGKCSIIFFCVLLFLCCLA